MIWGGGGSVTGSSVNGRDTELWETKRSRDTIVVCHSDMTWHRNAFFCFLLHRHTCIHIWAKQNKWEPMYTFTVFYNNQTYFTTGVISTLFSGCQLRQPTEQCTLCVWQWQTPTILWVILGDDTHTGGRDGCRLVKEMTQLPNLIVSQTKLQQGS